MRKIVVAEGLFSKLAISLNDSTVNKLAVINKEDNPLAKIESDLKKTLQEFERAYFELSQPKEPEHVEDK